MHLLDFAIGTGLAIIVQQVSIAEALSRSPPFSPWLENIEANRHRLGIGRLSSLGNIQSEKDGSSNASASRYMLEQSTINLIQALKQSPPEQWAAANDFADAVAQNTPSVDEKCLTEQKEARELIPLHPFRHLPETPRGMSDEARARCDSAWLAALKDTYESMQPVIKAAVVDLAKHAPAVDSNARNIRQQIEAIRQSGSRISHHSVEEKILDNRTEFLLKIRGKLRSMMQKDEESNRIAQEFQEHRLLVQMAPHYPDIDAECLFLRMSTSSPGVVDYLLSSRDKKQLEKELRCHRAWKHAMHDVWKIFFAEENFPEFFPPESRTILDVATSTTSKDATAAKEVGKGNHEIDHEVSGEEVLDLDRASYGSIFNGHHNSWNWKSKPDLEQVLSAQGERMPSEDVDQPEDPHDDSRSEPFRRTCHGFGAEMPHSDSDRCAIILQYYPGEAAENWAAWSKIAKPCYLELVRARVLDYSHNRTEQFKKAAELVLSEAYIKQTSHLYPELRLKCCTTTEQWRDSNFGWTETELDDEEMECGFALADAVDDIMKGIPRKEPISFWSQKVFDNLE